MNAIRLRTEYLKNPMGIDILHPRLMWNCTDGVKQTAYQIVTENWDSGRVESTSMHAVYPLTLKSRERVNWRVRLWDENDEPGEWSEAFFEMGLLKKNGLDGQMDHRRLYGQQKGTLSRGLLP